MRRPDGVTLVAIWHFIMAALSAIGLCGMAIPIVAVWADSSTNPGDAMVATIALMLGVVAILVFAVAFVAVGWGLWQLASWARVGAIVLAILQLFGFPIGTVAGGLTLWYLLADPDAKAAFGVAGPEVAVEE
jgi:hypothetical protein